MTTQRKFILILIFQLLAFWQVCQWYFLRLSTSSEEIYGLFALLVIGIFCFSAKEKAENQNFSIFLPLIFVFFYAITFPFFPPLLRAVIAVTSLTATLSIWRFGKNFHFGIWSLFLLSLPIIASLQFYLGYPLRVVIGSVTAFLLRSNGFEVWREEVCLHFGEKLIWIDAPCSGVKMLWAGFFLTSVLVCFYKFRLPKSLIAFASALLIIIIGNVFRATGLFYLEAEIVEMPAYAHEAIGVISFILTCAGIWLILTKLRDWNDSLFSQLEFSKEKSQKLFAKFQKKQSLALFAVLCIAAFVLTTLPSETEIQKPSIANQNFPKEFEGKSLEQLDLTEREKVFLQGFPGEIKRFTDGKREIIVRYVSQATRKLHPASDCFSAIGYSVKPLPIRIDENENKWSCFKAAKDGENLKVCERIYTNSGKNWTDVSSWYWSALSDSSGEGFWAITFAENITQ